MNVAIAWARNWRGIASSWLGPASQSLPLGSGREESVGAVGQDPGGRAGSPSPSRWTQARDTGSSTFGDRRH